MRFNGEWLQCDDGIIRPVIRAEILTSDGAWCAKMVRRLPSGASTPRVRSLKIWI